MRIAVWHNLPSGGGKRALYYHVRGLVERGHEVEIWCPVGRDDEYLSLRSYGTVHNVDLNLPIWKNRRLLPRSLSHYQHHVARLKAMDDHCRACAEEIERHSFDVLFANACCYFRTTSIAQHCHLPSAIYLQEPYRWLYEALPELPWLAMDAEPNGRFDLRFAKRFTSDLLKVQALRVQGRKELRAALAFDRILVNSFFSRESVLRAYGIDSTVCYLGIDMSLFRCLDATREDVVIGIGAFIPEKNIDFVIRSLATLVGERPRLVWIGNVADKSYLKRLKELAASLDVPFLPLIGISDIDVVTWLNRAKVFAYAPRLEPFGFAPLEANACGLPVVAVAEGGVRETVVNDCNGFLVPAIPDAFGEAVGRLLHDFECREKMGSEAQKLVSTKWSLNHAVERLEINLKQVAGKTGECVDDTVSRPLRGHFTTPQEIVVDS